MRMQHEKMTPGAFKQAIETRDAGRLASFYDAGAELRVIDRNHPPSHPLVLTGREAIAGFYDDICGRAMSHHIDASVAQGDHMSFTETCAYPDGTKVCAMANLELRNGHIVRETIVQAWDE